MTNPATYDYAMRGADNSYLDAIDHKWVHPARANTVIVNHHHGLAFAKVFGGEGSPGLGFIRVAVRDVRPR